MTVETPKTFRELEGQSHVNDVILDYINRAHVIFELDCDGTILSANPFFQNLMLHESDDILSINLKDICDEDYALSPGFKQFMAQLQGSQSSSGEHHYRDKSGASIWIKGSCDPVLDKDGTLTKFVFVATNVTAERHALAALLQKTSGFDNSSAAMMAVNRDLVVTEVNKTTIELLGKSAETFAKIWPNFNPDHMVGSCIDIFHKDPAHQRTMLSDPSILPYRTDITIGDFKFALNVGGIFDDAGNYVGNLLEWDDVTEERVNTGILAALDRSQAVVEFTLDGTVTAANANFLNIAGYALDEIVGQHDSLFVDPAEASAKTYKKFWKDLASGEVQEGEFLRIGKGGKEVWMQATYNPIFDRNGKPFKVVKFATNVTEQVAMRKTAETLSLVANETDNSVVITDAHGRIEYRAPRTMRLRAGVDPPDRYQAGPCVDFVSLGSLIWVLLAQ